MEFPSHPIFAETENSARIGNLQKLQLLRKATRGSVYLLGGRMGFAVMFQGSLCPVPPVRPPHGAQPIAGALLKYEVSNPQVCCIKISLNIFRSKCPICRDARELFFIIGVYFGAAIIP